MARLVEILALEMEEWPEGVTHLTQSSVDREIYNAFDGREEDSVDSLNPRFDTMKSHTEDAYPIVTRAQWQAERDRQKGGEWKRHRGGKQPVADDVVVEVKLRDGDSQKARASAFLWYYSQCDTYANIMQYRIISQPQAEEEVVKVDPVVAANVEAFNGQWQIRRVDGPLVWRDTVNELDAYIEEFTRERESLINRLALEGFALLPAMTAVVGVQAYDVPAVDMGDWRNWEIGDHLEIFDEKEGHEFKMGQIVKVTEFDGGDEDLPVKASSLNDDEWWFVNNLEAKFIRRP